MPSLKRGLGPHMAIVSALKDYGKGQVDFDFLANILGRSRTELQAQLTTLQNEGVITTSDGGNTIDLAKS